MDCGMTDSPKLDFLPGYGGVQIAVHRLGAGRPVLMIHGLSSNATINWVRYGHAQKIADAGREAIMIDLRGHGKSEAPRDPAAYSHDVPVLDIEAVIAELGLTDFDLVGYSLGSRLSSMLVARGLQPKKLVLGGMGLEGLTNWVSRRAFFLSALERFDTTQSGDRDYMAIQFMKSVKIDPVAMRLLLMSMDDFSADALAKITMPTLVLSGDEDQDNGSANALTNALPNARLETVPGGHMSCITKPEFGTALSTYLVA
jgi:pimeloyl-ACP methyl ester carboxylesterase